MGRINTNIQSMIAQRVLSQNNNSLAQTLERLSTGYRVNRGKDDPAGLIASENLRASQRGLNAAVANADRADQVVGIAEGGLTEVQAALTELQALLVQAANKAGVSAEEKAANQLSVDSLLQTIDRIASSTNFQGMKLLNGNFDFTLSSVAAGVQDVNVRGAKYTSNTLGVDALVTASAQQAGLFLSAGGSALDLNTTSTFVIEIGGSLGSREMSFASGTSLTNIAAAINSFKNVTGVEASVSGTGIKVFSSEFGSAQNVSVKVVNAAGINDTANGDGGSPTRGVYRLESSNFGAASTAGADRTTFVNAAAGVRDKGQNIGVTINGVQATGVGRTARVSTDSLDVEITLSASAAQTLGSVGGGPAFHITGGGAEFLLDGKADFNGRVSVGVQRVSANRLGNSTVGFLSSIASGRENNLVDGNVENAQKIVSSALSQVSALRGRLGSFQKNTVGATIRSLGVAIESTAAAESVIRDAEFATETAQLTRTQILVSSATNVLGLANQAPQSALQLLG